MDGIIFLPKNKRELKLLQQLARQMHIDAGVISEKQLEELEDKALLKAMAEADRTYSSREELMKVLKGKQ